MTESGQFKYGLQALLRKRSSELDLVKAELATAQQQFDVAARALDAQAERLAVLQTQQRDLHRQGASIDIDQLTRLHQCLRSAVLQKDQCGVQLEQARQQREAITAQVNAARQALKAIERHREHAVEQFNAEQVRKALLASDDLHLSSLPSNSGATLAPRRSSWR